MMSKFYLETIEEPETDQFFKQFFKHCHAQISTNCEVMCP